MLIYIMTDIWRLASLFTEQVPTRPRIGYGHLARGPRTLTNVTDLYLPVRGASVSNSARRHSIESRWCAAPW
ncbi:hypothetical protein B8W66_18860 [Mycobacterium decipiens]|uniref:Uncharacterized protein n=1 Tax=Mycobacterium decipiens TaxID=1430326 RepID=A0A1X2LQY2_9MYCO|nr:hypothetical protein B8W66_18860 [Mycobacterium decipiens]